MKKVLSIILISFAIFNTAFAAGLDYKACEANYDMCDPSVNQFNTCAEFYSCQRTAHTQLNALILNAIETANVNEVLNKCKEKREILEAMIEGHALTIECWKKDDGGIQFGG